MKKIIIFCFIVLLSQPGYSQKKVDILINGASAVGSAAAIQAARSGVKVLLVAHDDDLLYEKNINFNIPSFDTGIWKEWQLASKTDTLNLKEKSVLEFILSKEKNIQLIKNIKYKTLKYKKNSWKLTFDVGNEEKEISSKVIIDATENDQAFNKLIKKILNNTAHQNTLNEKGKLLTSIAGAKLNDSSLFSLPLKTVLFNQEINYINYPTNDSTFNIATKINIGQAIGALAAYSPFFDVDLTQVDVRTIQTEILNYKGMIIPVKDVLPTDSAFKSIQLVLVSGFMNFNIKDGLFKPDDLVNFNESVEIIKTLFPRSKIWFTENKFNSNEINLEQLVSLISFINGREIMDIKREINQLKEFNLSPQLIDYGRYLSRKNFAILCHRYLKPYTVKVNQNGYFIN